MKNPVDVIVGLRVSALRVEKRLTSAGLAAAIGVTPEELAAIEAGAHVHAARLLLLKRALDVEIGAFFDVEGSMVGREGTTSDAVAIREGLILAEILARIRNPSSRAVLIELAHHLAALERVE